MDYTMIETCAYDELQTLVGQLLDRVSRFCSRQTSEEVSKALNITLRALQYYRQIGIVPYTSLGNKVFFRERDIAHILQHNLIQPTR